MPLDMMARAGQERNTLVQWEIDY
uniref:Uncharacterized protein n=1 Tax=Rhizophora mucronata TaxID=61149 RepID=A0A2P2R376_RHIMU